MATTIETIRLESGYTVINRNWLNLLPKPENTSTRLIITIKISEPPEDASVSNEVPRLYKVGEIIEGTNLSSNNPRVKRRKFIDSPMTIIREISYRRIFKVEKEAT